MNIIQLNSYVTLNGGSETVMSNLGTLLVGKGHSVINMGYTSVKETKVMPYAYSLGKEKYSLPTFFFEKKTVDLIIDKINSTNTELVICHNVYHKYPLAALLKSIKRRTRAKLMLIFHDYKAVCPRCNLYNGKRICTDCTDRKFINILRHRCRYNSFLQSSVMAVDSYYNNSLRDAYSFPDIFITPSHFMAAQLKKMGFRRDINVIHNPINIAEFTRTKTTQGFQKTVLYAGRFSKDKGIELYLDAAAKMGHIQFLIAGTGDLQDMVEQADKNMANVSYLGSLNREQLLNAFDRADYLVLPSIWYENNPMIIIEAMTYGLAVVGSDIGGIPELLKEGRGFLFDPLKSDTLPMLLEKLSGISMEEYKETTVRAKAFAATLSFDHYYKNLAKLAPELEQQPVLNN
jgi:glycosyltransferase involved in cell wall biosynthesis